LLGVKYFLKQLGKPVRAFSSKWILYSVVSKKFFSLIQYGKERERKRKREKERLVSRFVFVSVEEWNFHFDGFVFSMLHTIMCGEICYLYFNKLICGRQFFIQTMQTKQQNKIEQTKRNWSLLIILKNYLIWFDLIVCILSGWLT
jgi:hypothetical protein